jgi:methylmalonyl-CoA/ethylmalonyl-CoA epimerase
MIQGIDHVAITVSDMERSIDFYSKAFGFRTIVDWVSNLEGLREIVFLELGGTRIELIAPTSIDRGRANENGAGIQHLCFRTDDVAKECRRLQAMGVKVLSEPHTLGDTSFRTVQADPDYDLKKGLCLATIEGPDGESIELLEG